MRRTSALVIATLVAACGGTPSSSAPSAGATTGSPAASIPATPPPAPTQTAAPVGLSFERATMPAELEIGDVIAVEAGFVAVGCRRPAEGLCRHAVALTSADGRAWAESEVADSDHGQASRVAVTSLGLFAVGEEGPPDAQWVTAAAWRSDDGRAWERVDLRPGSAEQRRFIGAGGVGDRAVLAAGGGPGRMTAIGLEAWITTRAGGWDTHQAFFSPTVEHIVSAAPGLVAIGSACADVCGPLQEVLVWRSTAGMGWSPEPHSRSLEGATVVRPAAWGDRVVLVGSFGIEDRVRAAIWLDGGGAWTATELPDGEGLVARAIVASRRGLYALGSDWSEPGRDLTAWSSTDGRVWALTPVDGIEGRPVALAVGDGTLIAITDAGLWFAELPVDGPDVAPPPPATPVVGPDGCLVTDAPGFRDVLLLDPTDRVRCLGGRELTLEAWIVPWEGGGVCPVRTPAFLAACDPPLHLLAEPGPYNGIFDVRVDPSQELTVEQGGKMARIQGHFDDPRALTCRSEEPADDPDAVRGEELIRRCRESFVVMNIEIIGTP